MPRPPLRLRDACDVSVQLVADVTRSVAGAVEEKLKEMEARLDTRLLQLTSQQEEKNSMLQEMLNVMEKASSKPERASLEPRYSRYSRYGSVSETQGAMSSNASMANASANERSDALKSVELSKGELSKSCTTTMVLDAEVNRIKLMNSDSGFISRKAAAIVKAPTFDGVFGVMIILNALIVGSEIEYKTNHENTHDTFIILSYIFCIVFVVELALRLLAAGRTIFLMPDWKWLIFDLFMVLVSLGDIIDHIVGEGTGGSSMKLIRVARLMRIVRVLRFVPKLRMIIFQIMECLGHLFWLMILLLIILYIFSLCFTMAATEYLRKEDVRNLSQLGLDLSLYYGTVPRSLYACMKAMLDGQSWGELMDPLVHVDWIYASIFILYITFSMLALLNIVTGAFVNGALEKASFQREMVNEKEIRRRKVILDSLKQIFVESDADGSGTITEEEFQARMSDPAVEPYMAALNIDMSNIGELFGLLDKDDSGTIDIYEFVENLMELMQYPADGAQKHFAKFASELQRIKHHLSKLTRLLGRGSDNGLYSQPPE